MLFELIINAICPYPFLKGIKYKEYVLEFDLDIEYEINSLLLVFMFVRVYLLGQLILSMSQFMNNRSNRVCLMNGCEADTMFAIKGLFN